MKKIPRFSCLAWCLILSEIATHAAELAPGVRKVKDVIIYEDARFHSAFPSIIKKPDGELLLAFRRAPNRKALGEDKNYHVDPNSYLVQVKSRDGETWTPEPGLVYAHAFGGSQDPCLLQLRDGTILCQSYGWTFVRPDGVPKLKPPFLQNFPGSIFNGGYGVRSTDGGKTWAGPFYPPHIQPEILNDPFGQPVPAYNRGAMVEGRDGRIFWVCAASDQETPRKTSTHLLISEDKGVTWKYSCPVAADSKASFNETSIYETPKGDLVAFLRSENLKDEACIARSTDGGKSFQPWKGMGFQGHPLHALRLPDNRVLLTYGYRHAPLGIRARILNAECTDFATAPEMVLRDDGGTTDLGYPWSVQLDEKRVLVSYYYNVGSGIQHIAGTILEIDRAGQSAARSSPAPAGALDKVLQRLTTAEALGVDYVHDDLSMNEAHPVPLMIRTNLADPAKCGRRQHGWGVSGGVADAYTRVVLRDLPTLGNRSQLAQLSFRSTQTGVNAGAHGLVEMTLCRGTTPDDLPLRIRVEDGRFYILGLNGETVLAGDRQTPVLKMSADTVYTMTVLLFQKAVFARLSGRDIPGGVVELTIADRRRFVPGRPGFGLRPNAEATGGELAVFDWTVTPVGPATNCHLAVIGDSITAGIDGEPEAESYAHLVTEALGQDLVLNTGSGGSTTALDLGRFPFEIAPFRPEIVWIEGGTNDIGTGIPAEQVFKNMQRQAELVTWGGKAVFSTVPPRVLPTAAHHGELARLNQLIRESGRPYVDRHALVVDPKDPQRIRPEYCHADGIHITRPGQARIAEEAVRVLGALRNPAVQLAGKT